MQYKSGREAFWDGVRTLMPATPGVIPFGLVTGITAVEQGMSPGTTLGMTLLFYAGSAQMAALQLLRNDAFALVILLTVLVINLRFVMYSASLAPHLHHLPRRWKWPLSYMLSDQAYVLSILKLSSGELKQFGHYFFAGTAVSMWLSWQLSVMAGVFLGAGIPGSWSLDFAIPLVFLALLVPAIRSSASLGAACVGGLVAVLAIDMPYNLGLVMASLCGILTGLGIEHYRGAAADKAKDATAGEETP
ncbi:MAG: AzlC family ABC transporter permease [Oceanospirillaceae bacterium]|nr:AzlC family ABC transporter permease [Oceanospirillaceae bacterium]